MNEEEIGPTTEESISETQESYSESEYLAEEEEESLDLSPSDIELFLQRSEIWDKLILNEISIEDAAKILISSIQKSITQIEHPRRRGRKSSKTK